MSEKKSGIDQKLRGINKPTIFQLALFAAGLILAAVLWISLSGFVSCWSLTSLPGIPLPTCPNSSALAPIATDAAGTPVAVATAVPTLSAPDIPLPPPWDGASRVTILVIGLRGGTNQDCPLCTDTMILLTIDPVTKTAGMLSIPRDMWVNIPGFGYGKINSAYTLGDLYKLPGGGIGLTI